MSVELKTGPEHQCGILGHPDSQPLFCQDKPGHRGPHAAQTASGETVAWPPSRDEVEWMREQRRQAAELAIRALRPVAGAYDLPLFADSGVRADYADAIIELAERLGAYIQNEA